MFDTVIVPLDGSPHAEFAIPYAIDEARRHGAKLVLVHVIPRPEPCAKIVRRSGPLPRQGEWPTAETAMAKQEAHAYLQEVVARYGLDPGTTLCVAVGDPGIRLAAEAQRHTRPLVVMLTGDSTREARPPLSLVARYLMVAGGIPVLGVRELSAKLGPPQAGTCLMRPSPAMRPIALSRPALASGCANRS